MPITDERIKEIIGEHDCKPNRTGIYFYTSFMQIVLENENVSLWVWDNVYDDDARKKAFKGAGDLIQATIGGTEDE